MDVQIIILFLSYFVGSIPFGFILSYLGGLGDIRNTGSGNIGATNVFRKNKPLALLTLIFDLSKGLLAVTLAKSFIQDQTFIFISALFSIIGHIFPIWLLFRGGKGVATLLGTLILINYKLSACFILAWCITTIKFKYASLSSIISTLIILLAIYVYYTKTVFLVFLVIAMLIIVQHIRNISNILKGNERKVIN